MTTAVRRARRLWLKPPGNPSDRVLVNGQILIPSQFADLESFRRWCRSAEYPERGDVYWLNGTIWVSDDMEQAYTHNLIKMAIGAVLTLLIQRMKSGHVFGDRMRLSNPAANLSCEADLMFVSFQTLAAGAIRQIPAATGGVIEFEGTPEMVLEVVSDLSETKDDELRELYYAAGIGETGWWTHAGRRRDLIFSAEDPRVSSRPRGVPDESVLLSLAGHFNR